MKIDLSALGRLINQRNEYLRTPLLVFAIVAFVFLALVVAKAPNELLFAFAGAFFFAGGYVLKAHDDAARIDPRILLSDDYHRDRLKYVKGDDRFHTTIDLTAEKPVANTASSSSSSTSNQRGRGGIAQNVEVRTTGKFPPVPFSKGGKDE